MTGAVLLPTLLALTLSTLVGAVIVCGAAWRRGRTSRGIATFTALAVCAASVVALAATSRHRSGGPGTAPATSPARGPDQPRDRVVQTAPSAEPLAAAPVKTRPAPVLQVRRTSRVVAAVQPKRRVSSAAAPAATTPLTAARPAPAKTVTKASAAAPAPSGVDEAAAPDGAPAPAVAAPMVAPRATSSGAAASEGDAKGTGQGPTDKSEGDKPSKPDKTDEAAKVPTGRSDADEPGKGEAPRKGDEQAKESSEKPDGREHS